jgi:hypothetical protein
VESEGQSLDSAKVVAEVLQMETIHFMDCTFLLRRRLIAWGEKASLWKAKHLMDSNGIRDSEQMKLNRVLQRNIYRLDY